MKKTHVIIFFITIFAILTGCANDQYAIEKEFWQAQKVAKNIFRNPYATPPNELERVVNKLNNFIQNYSQNNLAIEAEFSIARLYFVTKEYDKARTQLKLILNKHSKSESVCSEAVFLTGNTYEVEDKWNLALQQYKRIIQDYPLTIRGLDIPIYIAQYYKIKFQPDKMITAYQEAIAHYRTWADKYPNSTLAFDAHTLVAQCYIELKDWQDAINTYNTIIENYKGKLNLDKILMKIALIYNKELKDKVKTKETLEKLIKDYPNSRLINTAKTLLKELEK